MLTREQYEHKLKVERAQKQVEAFLTAAYREGERWLANRKLAEETGRPLCPCGNLTHVNARGSDGRVWYRTRCETCRKKGLHLEARKMPGTVATAATVAVAERQKREPTTTCINPDRPRCECGNVCESKGRDKHGRVLYRSACYSCRKRRAAA